MTTFSRSYFWPGYTFQKSWQGADGKYDAEHKLKWNDYHFMQVYTSYTVPKFNGNGCQTFAYPTSLWDNNDELALIAKATAKCRGHSFNAGVAIAEGSQTIALATGTALRFYRTIAALKKGRLADAARALGVSGTSGVRKWKNMRDTSLRHTDVSGLWLEIQYGWKPLLSDIEESAKAFEACFNKPQINLIKVSHLRTDSKTTFTTSFTQDLSVSESSSEKVTLRVQMESGVPAANGMGLCDPYSIAWELLPFSFVADWFIPIGSYIDSVSQVPLVVASRVLRTSERKRCVNVYRNIRQTRYVNGVAVAEPVETTTSSSEGLEVTRALTGFPQPPAPQFKPLSQALSVGHLENALALLTQIVSK